MHRGHRRKRLYAVPDDCAAACADCHSIHFKNLQINDMKRYHITFRLGEVVTGRNYEAKDEIAALKQWRNEYTDQQVTFLYVASQEMFEYKY